MIFSAAVVLGLALFPSDRSLAVWSEDFVVVYPDGTECAVENSAEIRAGDAWGGSSYVITSLELERRGSAAGDRVRAILHRV